jgi:hypothetical protein
MTANMQVCKANADEQWWRAAKKILAKMKSGRPTEATLAELIAGEFEELTR